MSMLDEILLACTPGKHIDILYQAARIYFRGDDWDMQVKCWAAEHGFRVIFSDQHQICTFYPASPDSPPR